jgi:1-acyl-sn-glycerol-3-phosphate acyltransferase
VAAFGVTDPAIGTERLVVIAETRQRETEARARLREAVADRVITALGLPADTIVIADPGAVLKTPSGKVRRSATRQAYIAGALGRRPSARRQWLHLLAGTTALRVRGLAASAARLGYGVRVGLLLAPAFPVIWIAALVLPAGRPLDRAVRLWSRTVLALAGCRLEVRGIEHLPPGPCVLAANHGSYLDAIALFAAIPADFRFVAKRELLAAPIVGRVIRRVGHLPVERTDLARSVADAAQVGRALGAGMSLFFFPEGTFVRAPGLLPFRLGTFKAAVDAGSPVVPVAIRGTRRILPAGAWLPRRGTITVTVKPALHADEPGWRGIVGLRDRTRAAIAEELVEAQAVGI